MTILRTLAVVLLLLALPAAAQDGDEPSRPNVLFIIADDLAANALGCYGNDQVLTPHIDALAERGLLFERAYCQYPVCGAARAALLSGLYPQQNGVTGNSDRDILSGTLGDHPTLPEHFRNNGYTSVRCGKLYHMRVPGDITNGVHGPDHPASWSQRYSFQAPEWMTEGEAEHLSGERLRFEPDTHYSLGFGGAFYVVRDPTDGAIQHDVLATDRAIEVIDELKDEPFFLAVGYVRPHVPLVAPQPYFDLCDPAEMTLPTYPEDDLQDIPRLGIWRVGARSGTNTDERRRRVLAAYYASVSFMDAQVGRLLAALDEHGLTDNTIVVFLSDHGYHLGEHDFWQKLSLHEESARIPLIIAGGGVRTEPWEGLFEAVDLYPTLSALVDLEIPERCVGMDAEHSFDGERQYAYCLGRNGHLIRTEQWAYMRYRDGSEELYDMVNDPQQFTNLAGHDDHGDTITELRQTLERHLEQYGGQ